MTLNKLHTQYLKTAKLYKTNLNTTKLCDSLNPDLKRSATLILCARDTKNNLGFLMTERSKKMSVSPSLICFPGGKHEKGELLHETALREAREEITSLQTTKIDLVDYEMPFTYEASFRIRNRSHFATSNDLICTESLKYNTDEVASVKFFKVIDGTILVR